MSRLLAALVFAAACSGGAPNPSVVSNLSPQEQLNRFCATYESVVNLSRQEAMVELLRVAPDHLTGQIKRASELGSSHEDDAAIDDYIDRC